MYNTRWHWNEIWAITHKHKGVWTRKGGCCHRAAPEIQESFAFTHLLLIMAHAAALSPPASSPLACSPLACSPLASSTQTSSQSGSLAGQHSSHIGSIKLHSFIHSFCCSGLLCSKLSQGNAPASWTSSQLTHGHLSWTQWGKTNYGVNDERKNISWPQVPEIFRLGDMFVELKQGGEDGRARAEKARHRRYFKEKAPSTSTWTWVTI